MDGSKYTASTTPSDATRVALRVDRDAVGLMKHASQLSHLLEWWLQGYGASLDAMAAFRIGRRLERFRLAARLAEGRASNQVRTTLDGLRSEIVRHPVPAEVLAELDAALRECERLKASVEPPTLVREAFSGDTGAMPERAEAEPPPRRRLAPWLLLLAALGAGAWWFAQSGLLRLP